MTDEERALMQEDLLIFATRCYSELHPGQQLMYAPYLDLIAAKLTTVLSGDGPKRLIISLPPRTLKSVMVSIAFVAWLLGRFPTKRIICASYGQELADKLGRDTRTIMLSSFYKELFPWTRLSPSRRAVNDFSTTQEGFRMATSVGGTLTGRGADILIADDPIKPQDAHSDTVRTATNDWYFNTLLSRLNDKTNGVIIIVMQRLHQQDLVGEVLDREQWEVISLPAIAVTEENHVVPTSVGTMTYSRKTGEALHPERDPVETFRRIRNEIGEYDFQSQYQQDPGSREGGLIKREWLKYYEPEAPPKDLAYVVQSWDTAHKSGQTNDYSVGTTWGVSNGSFYLLDVMRGKWTFPELKRTVLNAYHARPGVWKVLIEDKSSGISLIQDLQAEGMYCIETCASDAGMSKHVRLAAQSIKFESWRVYLPICANWLDDYVRELTGFPGTKYDDQVDSTTQALGYLGQLAPWTVPMRFRFNTRAYETW